MPAGYTYILRELAAGGGASTGDTLYLRDDTAGIQVIRVPGQVTYSPSVFPLRQVFEAGQSCSLVSVSGGFSARLCGYTLSP